MNRGFRMKDKLKEVSKAEFDDYIKNYGAKKLNSGVTTVSEPPFRSYRDELLPTSGELGSHEYYFDKEVARISMDYEVLSWERPIKTRDCWKYYILREEK